MEEIKREVVTEEVIAYKLTKEELDEIKHKERVKGRYDIIEYVRFAWNNFYLELNTAGRTKFLIEMFNCIVNEECVIKNTHNLSFKDYIRKYGSE